MLHIVFPLIILSSTIQVPNRVACLFKIKTKKTKLKNGDVIIKANNKRVATSNELAVQINKDIKFIKFQLIRNKKMLTVKLKLTNLIGKIKQYNEAYLKGVCPIITKYTSNMEDIQACLAYKIKEEDKKIDP